MINQKKETNNLYDLFDFKGLSMKMLMLLFLVGEPRVLAMGEVNHQYF